MGRQTATCPQCGAASRLKFIAVDSNRRISDEKFPYFACAACNLIFLNPIPAELERYYPIEYYTLPSSRAELEDSSRHEQYKIDIVTSQVAAGRLIEVGPATGGFCFLAKEAGFDVHAIEMDARCAGFLRDVVGIRVQNSNEEAAALAREEPADVIALWHVVEHLRDPWAMLEAIAGKLREGGIAVIATPNPDAFQFRVWGRRWAHVDAPRHVVLIPSSLLIARMRMHGLELVRLTTSDPGGIGWNWFGWVFSAANLTAATGMKRPLRILGRIVRALVKRYEDAEGRGAAYTAVFRKAPR
jgi:2-polyprenyl-3-methyl-5-hydroxy-6-metoxy-1,4-benzoquinol methylase